MTYTTYAENIDLEVIPKDLEATVKIAGSVADLEVNKPRKINIRLRSRLNIVSLYLTFLIL